INLEDDSAARERRTTESVCHAAGSSRPVEVAGRVADDTGQRACSVHPAAEGVQHGLIAAGIQLEHHSAAPLRRTQAACRVTAVLCSAVEVAGRVEDYAGGRVASVGAAGEAV